MDLAVAHVATAPYVAHRSWTVGIDLGQASDPTAIAAVEAVRWQFTLQFLREHRLPSGSWMTEAAEQIAAEKPRDELRVRALQRLPLGTSYLDQVQQIATLLQAQPLASAKVFIDATGVGKPVVDLFKHAGIDHKPVWITGGREQQSHGGGFSVPKLLLISRLQAALHSGELKIAKALPEAAAFTRELQEFRVSWTENGNVRFGARQGAHDDLVLATALAVYGATQLRGSHRFYPLSV